MNLGAGNHLIVSDEYSEQFAQMIKHCKEPSEIYRDWLTAALCITGGLDLIDSRGPGRNRPNKWTAKGISYDQEEMDTSLLDKEDKTMTEMFITITGTQFRLGTEFLERGDVVKLIKEPDNEYDKEAIRVELKPLGKIGYVANSTKTVIGDCFSAGRLYDKIGDKAKAEIVYVLPEAVIAKVKPDKKEKKLERYERDQNS